jgi:Dehydrogenases with different specificities (related to short-chain alcohol dehydrogenases)
MNATYSLSKGIRINCVAPGNLMFDGSTWEKKMNENPKFVETIISETPLKRLGKPEDIFGAVDFLVSEESSYMVGVIMVVDGGISL